jgi:hypothetical protein
MPTNRDSDVWAVNSTASEARGLYSMLGRNGTDVTNSRRLIDATATEELELGEWAAECPHLASLIETMLSYRREVLFHFDRLAAPTLCAAEHCLAHPDEQSFAQARWGWCPL